MLKTNLAAIISLVFLASFAITPETNADVGIAGGTSFSPGSVFPFPAGIESTVKTSFYVQNFGNRDLELELSYGTEPGITIAPNKEQASFLPAGSSTDFFFDITIDPTVPPGQYPVIVNLRQANFESLYTDGSVYRPALAGQFTVDVEGEGANISIRSVSSFDGEPAIGALSLYYFPNDESKIPIFEITDSGFDRTLISGSYLITYEIPNQQTEELKFEVASGEDKEVLFEVPTLDFISVGATPTRNSQQQVQLVSLSMKIVNNLRPIDGPVQFLTKVYRDDQQIDQFAISTLTELPPGETLQRANYPSPTGFVSGDYEFRFFIKNGNLEVEGPRSVTFNNPDPVPGLLSQTLLILAVVAFALLMIPRKWLGLVFKRRKRNQQNSSGRTPKH